MIASPNEICTGGTSTLTADIKQRNAGAPLTTELNGLPEFPAIFSNAMLGSLSGGTQLREWCGHRDIHCRAGLLARAALMSQPTTKLSPLPLVLLLIALPILQIKLFVRAKRRRSVPRRAGKDPTFVWKKGVTILNSGDLGGRVTITSGSNTSTLSISNTVATDADTYTVDATSTCNTSSQSATLTVQPSTTTSDPADVAECQGQDAHFSTTASGAGPFSYAWTLDGNPFNGDSSSITIPTGSLSAGNHTVTVTTTGACGSAVQSATLTVGGTPVITFSTTTASVWPPNHQYQTFNVTDFVASASSDCDPELDVNDVVIVSVSSDEPENSVGADGNTLNDIVIAANCKSVSLRRERDNNLNGRVYTITFKVTDSSGNFTTATAKVSVPINQNGGGAVDDGAAAGYTVNSVCP